MEKRLFNPLEHPACLELPLLLDESAWLEHIPFGMFLVSALRPRVLVELGAYTGVSYCAFCQAVKFAGLDTRCYAIDTWRGDVHAGELDGSVLSALRVHHDPLYSEFSELIRSTFDDALSRFPDRSVDLLHIDGLHTYDAVNHDFETWLPKMSDRGVVLFHDTNVHRDDFGVWRLWAEVSSRYPSFEFLHGHGLGVLFVGGDMPDAIASLFTDNESDIGTIRKFFQTLGAAFISKSEIERRDTYIEHLRTHEAIVLRSPVMRVYRILRFEGIGSLLRKARNARSSRD
jgi:hypothetical protein